MVLSSGQLTFGRAETKLDMETLRVSFSLICMTFGRDDVDSQGNYVPPLTANTPTFNHPVLSSKRFVDVNSIDAIENTSTCTGTTMVGDFNK